jgi:hypothetical protein
VKDKLREDSDIDLLVSFEPGAPVGFPALARRGRELSELLGRPVDLVPRDGLKPAIRDEVLATASPSTKLKLASWPSAVSSKISQHWTTWVPNWPSMA